MNQNYNNYAITTTVKYKKKKNIYAKMALQNVIKVSFI